MSETTSDSALAKSAKNQRLRPPMSEDQRQKLSRAQKAYVENDPRWEAHRAKLAAAQQKSEQRSRLSAAQLAYMSQDPRWPAHRARMTAAAVEVTRFTLLPEEIDRVVEMRGKGRNFEYIGEELCVSDKVIRRELRALDIPTRRVPRRPKAKRSKGFWRCMDATHA
jgi:hypothetical protein